MKPFQLDIPPHVAEVIRHCSPEIKKSIKSALRHISKSTEMGTPLVKELKGYWKFRVRRFRIVYSIDLRHKILRVVAVGNRRGIYEEVAALVQAREYPPLPT